MKTYLQDNGHTVIVQLAGSLDRASVDTLKQSLRGQIRQDRSALILNMKEVSFISSRGLETLLWVRNACRRYDIQFRLVELTDCCQTIMKLTRLSNEFLTCQNTDDAIKSLM